MLIAFVVLYLLLTIAIGLRAARRVHNSNAYMIAGSITSRAPEHAHAQH